MAEAPTTAEETAAPDPGAEQSSPLPGSFPPLSASPYPVGETDRIERWWYAEGLKLEQEAEGASVGFAWTQWLADRGVEVGEEELGEEYARELYHAGQRAMGVPEGPDSGITIAAAVQVLFDRGLLEGCYECPDIDTVVAALLERGPLIAGIGWRASMQVPIDRDGWMVCRPEPGESLLGGHCVVLNGISRDLTIDGITGFVRLKNSWGSAWGDEGQALLSIADLDEVKSDLLLPIPLASALRSGLHREVATDGVPYGPRNRLFKRSAIQSDTWTRQDSIGSLVYAEAIARSIRHPATRPPLTIGIKGAWGAGKTSLMAMIRDRLEWPGSPGTSEELREIHLVVEPESGTGPSRRPEFAEADSGVSYRRVLREIRKGDASEEPGDLAAEGKLRFAPGSAAGGAEADRRWRPTVWFNPWIYQTGEQIWAGLAHEIISQITSRMDRAERERFWLRLNLKRVDEQAVRRRIYALILEHALPFAVLGLVLLVTGLVLLVSGALGRIGAYFAAAGPAAALLGLGGAAARVLPADVRGTLSGLVEPVGGATRAAGGQLTGAYEELVEHPDYRTRAGALYLVQTDVKRVLDLVATEERPLVIFIDDLDRCSPGSVVQVIEAINLFVAGPYPNTIFVIAMEPEMVAAHVEAAYGDLVEKLEKTNPVAGQSFDVGWRFLEKIVQLPLALPAMESGRTATLYESLFAAGDAPEPSATTTSIARDAALASSLAGASLAEAVEIAGDVRPSPAAREQVIEVVERKLTTDDPDVRAVIAYASRRLRHNPREIKRFVNLFRFFTMIYTERRLERLPAPESLAEVAKLAVLGIRWPGLLSALAVQADGSAEGGRTVFELLEKPPGGEVATREALEKTDLSEGTIKCLLAPDLFEFLKSEPQVGVGVRGYL